MAPWWARTPMPQKDAPVKRGRPRVVNPALKRLREVMKIIRTRKASSNAQVASSVASMKLDSFLDDSKKVLRKDKDAKR